MSFNYQIIETCFNYFNKFGIYDIKIYDEQININCSIVKRKDLLVMKLNFDFQKKSYFFYLDIICKCKCIISPIELFLEYYRFDPRFVLDARNTKLIFVSQINRFLYQIVKDIFFSIHNFLLKYHNESIKYAKLIIKEMKNSKLDTYENYIFITSLDIISSLRELACKNYFDDMKK